MCKPWNKKELKDYQIVGILRNIAYILDNIPYDTDTPIKGWQCLTCREKYIWKTTYGSIKRGSKCPNCTGAFKLNLNDYKIIGISRGIEYILDYIPKNNDVPIKGWQCIKCSEKHIWKARYHDIQAGYGCPNCAGCIPKKIKDYHQICQNKKISYILDYIPKNIQTPIEGWKCLVCPNGKNIWNACYGSVQQGHGCPNCCKSKSEKLCRTYFEEALMESFPSCRPNFLKYFKTGRNLELDGYNEKFKIAFEYQGPQHYKKHYLFHKRTDETLEYQQEKDIWKAKRCEELGIKLIIIPYKYSFRNTKQLRNFIYDELFKIC